jgi:hypothetical protein
LRARKTHGSISQLTPLKSHILNLKSNWLCSFSAFCLLLTLAVTPVLSATGPNFGTAPANQLTRGWTPVPLKFQIQKPYDLQVKDRYSYDAASDTHDFWVFFTDKPHDSPPNKTTARTEMRLESFRDK